MAKKAKRVDRYDIIMSQQLGEGSFGNVYIGIDTRNSEKRAIKIIPKNKIEDKYMSQAFRTQIKIMGQVRSPGTVRCYDVLQSPKNYYVVMEFCEGGDLRKLLNQNQKGIPVNLALNYFTRILKCFRVLAQKGITHRDIKPQNILISNNNFKLCDFGFAKASQGNYLKSIVGTPVYMAPQILKKTKYTYKCDIWSLGIIFFQLLYGRRPIPHHITSLLDWIQKNQIIYPQLDSQNENLNNTIILFISKCLKIKQQQRYGWQEIYNHKLFRDELPPIQNLRLGYILSNLRLSIHCQNIDIKMFFDKYSKQHLTQHKFKSILSLLSNQLQDNDIIYLLELFGRKDPQNSNKILIDLQDLKKIFEDFGIRTQSVNYSDILITKSNGNQRKQKQQQQYIDKPIVKQQSMLQKQQLPSQQCLLIINQLRKIIKQQKIQLYQLYSHQLNTININMNLQQFFGSLKKIKKDISENQCIDLFKVFDINHDGKVSHIQFFKALCQISGQPTRSLVLKNLS